MHVVVSMADLSIDRFRVCSVWDSLASRQVWILARLAVTPLWNTQRMRMCLEFTLTCLYRAKWCFKELKWAWLDMSSNFQIKTTPQKNSYFLWLIKGINFDPSLWSRNRKLAMPSNRLSSDATESLCLDHTELLVGTKGWLELSSQSTSFAITITSTD